MAGLPPPRNARRLFRGGFQFLWCDLRWQNQRAPDTANGRKRQQPAPGEPARAAASSDSDRWAGCRRP